MLFSPFNYLYSNIHIRTFNGIPLVTNIIWIISFSQIHTLKFRWSYSISRYLFSYLSKICRFSIERSCRQSSNAKFSSRRWNPSKSSWRLDIHIFRWFNLYIDGRWACPMVVCKLVGTLHGSTCKNRFRSVMLW